MPRHCLAQQLTTIVRRHIAGCYRWTHTHDDFLTVNLRSTKFGAQDWPSKNATGRVVGPGRVCSDTLRKTSEAAGDVAGQSIRKALDDGDNMSCLSGRRRSDCNAWLVSDPQSIFVSRPNEEVQDKNSIENVAQWLLLILLSHQSYVTRTDGAL